MIDWKRQPHDVHLDTMYRYQRLITSLTEVLCEEPQLQRRDAVTCLTFPSESSLCQVSPFRALHALPNSARLFFRML